MLVHHLPMTYAARPMQGHRAYITPLVHNRRPAIAPREPELPLGLKR